MTKKDFKLIAGAFNDSRKDAYMAGETYAVPGILLTARYVASALSKAFPNFNKAKFLAACQED